MVAQSARNVQAGTRRCGRPRSVVPRPGPFTEPFDVIIDNHRVRIELHGVLRLNLDGWPDVSGLRAWIWSKLDDEKRPLCLKLSVLGNPLPYLGIYFGPITRYFPKLTAHLASVGFTPKCKGWFGAKTVDFQRLVWAAWSIRMSIHPYQVHHRCPDIVKYRGHGTLDASLSATTLMFLWEHRRLHSELGDEHFFNQPKERLEPGWGAALA